MQATEVTMTATPIDEQPRKEVQFVLALPLKANAEMVVPMLRADTQEEIAAVIENESLVDAETGKADWINGSQLSPFVHPSVIVEQGHNPIAEIRLQDWHESAKTQIEAQWDAQILSIPAKLDRMSENPFKKTNA